MITSNKFQKNEVDAHNSSSRLVEKKWLVRELNSSEVRILDVRDSLNYCKGHIPWSVNVHYKRFAELNLLDDKNEMLTEFETTVGEAGIKPSDTVVIYDKSDCLDAATVFWFFEYLNHNDVCVLNGGFEKWINTQGPIETTENKHKVEDYKATIRDELKYTSELIMANIYSKDLKIVDVRSRSEYLGETRKAKRGGHIPGALNIEWTKTINPDGTFKDKETLLNLFKEKEITPEKEIVTYCQYGHRAAHGYLTLRILGFSKVGVYIKSWNEWGNESIFPVEI